MNNAFLIKTIWRYFYDLAMADHFDGTILDAKGICLLGSCRLRTAYKKHPRRFP